MSYLFARVWSVATTLQSFHHTFGACNIFSVRPCFRLSTFHACNKRGFSSSSQHSQHIVINFPVYVSCFFFCSGSTGVATSGTTGKVFHYPFKTCNSVFWHVSGFRVATRVINEVFRSANNVGNCTSHSCNKRFSSSLQHWLLSPFL